VQTMLILTLFGIVIGAVGALLFSEPHDTKAEPKATRDAR
jgi:hypothetical protein